VKALIRAKTALIGKVRHILSIACIAPPEAFLRLLKRLRSRYSIGCKTGFFAALN
jgi:hypothetical protein